MGHATEHPERMNRESLIEGAQGGFWFRGLCPRGVADRNQRHDDGRGHQDRSRPQPGQLCRELDRGLGKGSPGNPPGGGRLAEDGRLRPRSEPAAAGTERATSRQERSLLGPHRMQPPCYREPDRGNPGRSMEADFSRVRFPYLDIPKANPSFSILATCLDQPPPSLPQRPNSCLCLGGTPPKPSSRE